MRVRDAFENRGLEIVVKEAGGIERDRLHDFLRDARSVLVVLVALREKSVREDPGHVLDHAARTEQDRFDKCWASIQSIVCGSRGGTTGALHRSWFATLVVMLRNSGRWHVCHDGRPAF